MHDAAPPSGGGGVAGAPTPPPLRSLSLAQAAVLTAVSLQCNAVDMVAGELGLPGGQVLATPQGRPQGRRLGAVEKEGRRRRYGQRTTTTTRRRCRGLRAEAGVRNAPTPATAPADAGSGGDANGDGGHGGSGNDGNAGALVLALRHCYGQWRSSNRPRHGVG